MAYLLAILIGTIFFQVKIDSFFGSPSVSAWITLIISLPSIFRFFRSGAKITSGLWIPLALLAGRFLASIKFGFGSMMLVALTFPLSWIFWSQRQEGIAPTLRRFGLVLASLALVQVAVGNRALLVNSNLLAHCMLISLAAYLPAEHGKKGDGRPQSLPGQHPPKMAMLQQNSRSYHQRRRWWIQVIFLLVGMLAMISRGAALGLGAMLIAYFPSWTPLILPSTMIAIPILIRLRPWNTIGWRLECWRRSLALWLDHPWLGAGPGIPPWPDHPMGVHAHNLALNTLIWSGLVGLALLGWALIGAVRNRHRWPRWVLSGLVGVLVHYLVDDFDGSALALAMTAALLARIHRQY